MCTLKCNSNIHLKHAVIGSCFMSYQSNVLDCLMKITMKLYTIYFMCKPFTKWYYYNYTAQYLTVNLDDVDSKMISRNISTPSTSCKNIATS